MEAIFLLTLKPSLLDVIAMAHFFMWSEDDNKDVQEFSNILSEVEFWEGGYVGFDTDESGYLIGGDNGTLNVSESLVSRVYELYLFEYLQEPIIF